MTCIHLQSWPYPSFCVNFFTYCSPIPFIHLSLCCTLSGRKFGWSRRAVEEAVCRSGLGEAVQSDEPELSELVTHSGSARSFYICLPAAEWSSGYRWGQTAHTGGSGAHGRGRKYNRYRHAFSQTGFKRLVLFTKLLLVKLRGVSENKARHCLWCLRSQSFNKEFVI